MQFRGVDLTSPINRLASGFVAVAVNVRAYFLGGFAPRTLLTDAILTVSSTLQTILRLNDSTPAGPAGGFTYILKDSAGNLYSGISGTLTPSATGLSGNPVSIVTFRPNTSVQPWAYLGDSAPSPTVTIVSPPFQSAGMLKIRSDGLVRKMGIAEPSVAPTATFPGGGSGPSQIFYYYTYYATETGAESNPSPVSIPGTNAQSSPSATQVAATAGVINPDITVNATQYEGSGAQIRTKGGVAPGTITDYIVAHGFGFTLPGNVTIDGVQVDLNWVGQNSGTGVLSGTALYYLGNQTGNPKFPAIQNQSFSTDTLAGGNGDTWGATLTPQIINDPSFGFGVQITTQLAGGSDRSFVNSMSITVFYSTQDANITPAASPDPQVNKINFYRQGGGLANPTFVGQGPNTATAFNDQLSDLAAASNPLLQFDNFEPFPGIDLPQQGTLNAASNILTWVSGGSIPAGASTQFNIRWLPGTIIIIGTPGVAYTSVRRPSGPTAWDFTNNDPTIPAIPNGTNLPYYIGAPPLAQQPLPYLFGPTDNINFTFAVGDPLRPGTLYWCKGNNLDSAPDTNQLEVTDPGEPLVNGAMSNGLGVLFSIKRAWIIEPNFYNALATVTGTTGSTWSLQATAINRGLFIPRCIAVEGGGRIFFRVDDGILVSIAGSAPRSITDESLYPLFSHEGSIPQSITRNGITYYPPDDTQPQSQQFSIQNGYLYYDYSALGVGGSYIQSQTVQPPGGLGDMNFAGLYSAPIGMLVPSVSGDTFSDFNIFQSGGNNLFLTFYNSSFSVLSTIDASTLTSLSTVTAPSGTAWLLITATGAPTNSEHDLICSINGVVNVLNYSQTPDVGSGVPTAFSISASSSAFCYPLGPITPGQIFRDFFLDQPTNGLRLIFYTASLTVISSNDMTIASSFTAPPGAAFWSVQLAGGSPDGDYAAQYTIASSTAAQQTLVFDILSMAWILDSYSVPVAIHAADEGMSAQGVLAGCNDNTLRQLSTSGIETATTTVITPAIGGTGWQHIREISVEYKSLSPITVSFIVADAENGSYASLPVTLPASVQVTKQRLQVSANKWKLLQLRFFSTDPSMNVYLEGLALVARGWGVDGPYRQVFPFAPEGGHGAQP